MLLCCARALKSNIQCVFVVRLACIHIYCWLHFVLWLCSACVRWWTDGIFTSCCLRQYAAVRAGLVNVWSRYSGWHSHNNLHTRLLVQGLGLLSIFSLCLHEFSLGFLPLGVIKFVNTGAGVLLPYAQCSQDGLWIYCDHDNCWSWVIVSDFLFCSSSENMFLLHYLWSFCCLPGWFSMGRLSKTFLYISQSLIAIFSCGCVM